ncbi:MAG: hypothetical protein K5981_08765 [Clostridia bacterium]|nr:hypothetical protein [Clostridia bacterium]
MSVCKDTECFANSTKENALGRAVYKNNCAALTQVYPLDCPFKKTWDELNSQIDHIQKRQDEEGVDSKHRAKRLMPNFAIEKK